MVRSMYARGAVEVRSWCGGALVVRSWCSRGTLVVRFRFASGSVRFVNFSTGDTVLDRSEESNGAVGDRDRATVRLEKVFPFCYRCTFLKRCDR